LSCGPAGAVMQKILIVDDNILFRKLLRESLHSQFPALNIAEAKDGDEALHMFLTFQPDLIFMDIQLPDQNGLKLTRLIKDLNRDVKIIILTSYDQPEYRDAAFQHKADHYCSKDSFMSLIDTLFLKHPLS
jgi:CheY-like chemotaxis protein